MKSAKIAAKIREQIRRFSGEVSVGLPKTAARLVREVVYGVQTRGSVRLSEIARALEETISLKKVMARLSRQLNRPGLRKQVRENLLRLAAPRVGKETLLVVDLTDVIKPYARKMEYLARVRDGSAKKLGNGYWCCQVVAARGKSRHGIRPFLHPGGLRCDSGTYSRYAPESRLVRRAQERSRCSRDFCHGLVGLERGSAEVMPLDQELYSQEAPGFVSENHEILKSIGRVSKATQGRRVWVIDAGGDRKTILEVLLNQGHRFVVRQRGDRHLISGRQRKSAREWADGCRRQHREVVVKETSSGEKVYPLEFGFRKVRRLGRTEPLYLMVVDGLGSNPLILLTNRKVTPWRKS